MAFDVSSDAQPTDIIGATAFEVVTISSDTLRAIVGVSGVLTDDNIALLTSALSTHLRAGHRYVRVDLTAAGVVGHKALAALVDIHVTAAELGGMLVFDHANGDVCAALSEHDLFLNDSS